LVELTGLGRRFDPEVPLERRHTLLVLPDGGCAVAFPRMEADQRAVRFLFERVGGDPATRVGDRLVDTRVPDELRQRRGQLTVERARRPEEPLVELGRVFEAEPGHEVAAVDVHGVAKLAAGDAFPEVSYVDS